MTLATDGVIGANGGPRSPGTAYILLHHCMGGVGGKRGLWGFVRGGMGAVSEAIAASARSHGAEIRTNAPVEQSWCATAARTAWCSRTARRSQRDDRRLESRPEADVPEAGRRARAARRISSTAIRALPRRRHVAQDESGAQRPAGFHGASPARPGRSIGATMHICPSIEYVERAWDDAKYGRPSQNAAARDDHARRCTIRRSRPPGKHIMGIFLQYAPYTLRDATWDELREPYGDRVLDVIAEYAPNIREHRAWSGRC